MSDWKADFHRAMIDALVRNGAPLDDKPTYYGWMHDEWEQITKRVREVGVDYDASTYEDAHWRQFQGTFYEGDDSEEGVDINLVLNDGSTVRYRWEGHIGELIRTVANS